MLLYAVAIIALQDLAALEVEAAAVAGTPVTIDRRLHLAQCEAPPAITRTGGGIGIDCAAPLWRIAVPVQRLAPIVRRGDAVSVVARGPGFDVTLDGTADADAAPGSRVRVTAAGGHLTAVVQSDGSLVATGYNLPR